MKAYPFLHKHPTTGETTLSQGMDLRDYFAAQAMTALIQAKPNEFVTRLAYEYADEMLIEREYKDE